MPSITTGDLANAKTDVDHIADIATSLNLTATDRLGHTKNTMAGAIATISAIVDRGAWATAQTYVVKDMVSNAGTWYICVDPHTSGATFVGDVAHWRVYQGVLAADLATSGGAATVGASGGAWSTVQGFISALISSIGSSLVGFIQSGTGAVARTSQDKMRDRVNAADFGMKPSNSAAANNAAFAAAVVYVGLTGQTLYITAGTYSLSAVVQTSNHLHIEGDGDATILDYSGTVTGGNNCIEVTGTLTQIQNISAATLGDVSLTFATSPASLSTGDVFVLYDRTDSSWLTSRTYYRKGEMCEFRGLAGLVASLTNPLYDSYTPANVDVYKLTGPSVSLRNFKIKGTTVQGLIKVALCKLPIIENVSSYNESYQCVEFERCFKPRYRGGDVYNKGTTLDDYGLVLSNCQHARVRDGSFYARRHGIAIGGGSTAGSVTGRDNIIIGASIKNDKSSGVYAADFHGNTEGCSYQHCTIYGGGGWAGQDNGYDHCTIYASLGGMVLYAGEIRGGELYARNCKFIVNEDPSAISRGIIDVGGNSSPISAATVLTLNLVVENCTLRGTNLSASTSLMVVANDGSAVYVNMKIDGVTADVNAMGAVLRTQLTSGTAFSQAIIVDRISNFPAGTVLHNPIGGAYASKPQRMMAQSGSVQLAATSGTAITISSPITYRYSYPRTPVGHATTGGATSQNYNGNRLVYSSLQQILSNTITPMIESGDATNWTATLTVTVNWKVGLSEV